MIGHAGYDGTRAAMDRTVAFWKRQMSDQILVRFAGAGARRSNEPAHMVAPDEAVAEGNPPRFADVPRLLRDYESSLKPGPSLEDALYDDSPGVPVIMPEVEFGNGIMGAIFGAKLHIASSKVHTTTFNEPVVTDWDQVAGLRFDENNEWVQRVLSCLRYFVAHASKPFAIRQFLVYEGANFIVSMRGTTQAFFDLADRPPELRQLYELGFTAGIRFFEMKRQVIQEHNEKVLRHPAYAALAPLHAMPWLDTDAYALCSRRVFEEIGFEFKQKILDHFGGGEMYVHGLGRRIVPAAGRLNHLTQLSLYDDPKCDPYFNHRCEIRSQTYDIPLSIACTLKELVDGLAERTLPGGVAYGVHVPSGVSSTELNHLMDRVRVYRAGKWSGRSR
jgi:hypothetical protein